ncbi:IS3 family transposase [Radiobacillus kanasensis]
MFCTNICWSSSKSLGEYMFYYNNKRIESKLKGKSPVQFRTLAQSAA